MRGSLFASFLRSISSSSVVHGEMKLNQFKNIPNIKSQFQNARTQTQLNLNDIAVHRDITFHAGGHNKSNYIRKFLFLICDAI